MKKLALLALGILVSQLAFAGNEEIQISTKCLNKLVVFSSHFAEANKMFYGSTPVSIGKVVVSPKAVALGESGFADGKGSYELIMKDEGETIITNVGFTFLYVTEPHCSVMRIEMTDVQ